MHDPRASEFYKDFDLNATMNETRNMIILPSFFQYFTIF